MTTFQQASLFDELPPLLPLQRVVQPQPREKGRRALTVEERFRRFHETNPHVFEALKALALWMRRQGATRWATKAMFELLRYQYWLQTRDENGYKLDNTYTRPYADLLMREVPELQGFFERRQREGEEESE